MERVKNATIPSGLNTLTAARKPRRMSLRHIRNTVTAKGYDTMLIHFTFYRNGEEIVTLNDPCLCSRFTTENEKIKVKDLLTSQI